MTTWYHDIIAELQSRRMIADDATRNFEACYGAAKGDDTLAAWEAYEASAESVEHKDGYVLLRFADGSHYADWKQGIDRFYPAGEEIDE